MPFTVIKKEDSFYLKRNDGSVIKKKFKSKQSALSQGLNYTRYRKEVGIIKGNKIIVKK